MTRLIVHLRLHQPAFEDYHDTFTTMAGLTPLVQALPPDAALLDLTGALRYLGRTPRSALDLLQTRITAAHGLTTTAAGASTRMHATILAATLPPGAAHLLDAADEPAFLSSQPVRALPGIGPALEKNLLRYGVATIGDLAALPRPTLARIAGHTTAHLLHDRAHGTDPRPVTPAGPPPSIAARRTFDRDALDPQQHHRALTSAVVELGAQLRHDHKCARQAELQLTFADRSKLTRARTLPAATAHTPLLQTTFDHLLTTLALQRARVRAITARVGELTPASAEAIQLTFDRTLEQARRLEPVIDRANARFGSRALTPALLLEPPNHSSRHRS